MLAKLLDKFDPKSDGADRSYADIYDESAKLLYEEIDYTLEGKNAERFKKSFEDIGVDYIRVPNVYWEATNPRVLTMEFIDCFKLTDIEKVEAEHAYIVANEGGRCNIHHPIKSMKWFT